MPVRRDLAQQAQVKLDARHSAHGRHNIKLAASGTKKKLRTPHVQ
jgi:hypothetical protein